MTLAIRGFYAVLDRDDERLARLLVGAGGARVLQVRVKPAHAIEIARIARMARRVCDDAGAALVVNDRVDVALAVGADGVHLGQRDLPIEAARAIAGYRLAIGVSTHDVDQVALAIARGADYLGFGPIFATRTKRDPDPVQGIAGLRAAVAAARGTPIVAIGGITPRDARAAYAAGAAAICAISAVNDAPDVVAAARAMRHNSPWIRRHTYTVLR
jgi:thiamine-phosphate pyrophosphorylase